MRNSSFQNLLSKVEKLTQNQIGCLQASLENGIRKRSINKLEEEFNSLSCPHCGEKSIGHWGERNGLRRYKCKSCEKTFNSLTGTPLARVRKKESWNTYAQGMLTAESLQDSADRLNITKKTAFKWRHRFLENQKEIKPLQLNGIVENDETYFHESSKGCRLGLPRKSRKRATKAKKRGLSSEQVCVFVSRDRNGNTYDQIFEKFNSEELTSKFLPHLANDALFYSDSKSVYLKFSKDNNVSHEALNLSKGERVRDKVVHIQNINAYHSRLKRWVEQFRGVATKYLDSYLSWFRAIEEVNVKLTSELIIQRAWRGGVYNVNP